MYMHVMQNKFTWGTTIRDDMHMHPKRTVKHHPTKTTYVNERKYMHMQVDRRMRGVRESLGLAAGGKLPSLGAVHHKARLSQMVAIAIKVNDQPLIIVGGETNVDTLCL